MKIDAGCMHRAPVEQRDAARIEPSVVLASPSLPTFVPAGRGDHVSTAPPRLRPR
jgi:hypothetical protein